eukprot:SAG11_NODE_22760_length_400_cov_1.611296_1_plen_49_part_10
MVVAKLILGWGQVHIVQSEHLDVGFSGYAVDVINKSFQMLTDAISNSTA